MLFNKLMRITSLLVFLIVFIFGAFSLPSVQKARIQSNETYESDAAHDIKVKELLNTHSIKLVSSENQLSKDTLFNKLSKDIASRNVPKDDIDRKYKKKVNEPDYKNIDISMEQEPDYSLYPKIDYLTKYRDKTNETRQFEKFILTTTFDHYLKWTKYWIEATEKTDFYIDMEKEALALCWNTHYNILENFDVKNYRHSQDDAEEKEFIRNLFIHSISEAKFVREMEYEKKLRYLMAKMMWCRYKLAKANRKLLKPFLANHKILQDYLRNEYKQLLAEKDGQETSTNARNLAGATIDNLISVKNKKDAQSLE